MDTKKLLTFLVVLLMFAVAGYFLWSESTPAEAKFGTATVHLSPDCGCCVNHARYLANAGVEVNIYEHDNTHLRQMRSQFGIPEGYRSCHTTEVGEWKIEGHVPLEIINEVVERQPEAGIISLPGMPSGSPGMPGAKTEEWVFYEIDAGEVTGEFITK